MSKSVENSILYENELSQVSLVITNYIYDKYKLQYKEISKNFHNIIEENDNFFDEIKNEIFGPKLNHYVYLLLAKCNCICRKKINKYCYSIFCNNKKFTPITNENNYNKSALNHKRRDFKSKKNKKEASQEIKRITLEKQNNFILYKENDFEKSKVLFENIASTNSKDKFNKFVKDNLLQNSLIINEIKLFNHKIIENVYNIIKSDSFNNSINEYLDKLINESLLDKILLNTKLKVLHNLFEIGLNLIPPDVKKFKNLTKKTNDYIDTTYGAGIYYLQNTSYCGFISVNAVKESFKALFENEKIKSVKFTEDHIYRRKLAANYLKNSLNINFSDFKQIYKDKFSFISFTTAKENRGITKWTDSIELINIDFEKFKDIYVEQLSKHDVNLIKTKNIYTSSHMKTFVYFLFLEKIKNKYKKSEIKHIESKEIEHWFNHYSSLINLFENDLNFI